MPFHSCFVKRAESKKSISRSEPWSVEVPSGQFALRFHPKRRRWSCDCQDFEHRRSYAPDEADFQDKTCKHIKSHLLGQNQKMIRADEIATGYKFPVDSYRKSKKSKGGEHMEKAAGFVANFEKGAKVLTAKGRKHIKEDNFALPGRRYPIHDESHARNALSRVAQYGTPEEQQKVRAAVARKYPGLGHQSDKAT